MMYIIYNINKKSNRLFKKISLLEIKVPSSRQQNILILKMFLGRPDSPYNCSLINQTLNSLELECIEGFDGGQTQVFQLEVYNFESNYLLLNRTSKQPAFKVEGLAPGVNVKIIIYAFNSKGRSDSVNLEGYTLKLAEKQTGISFLFKTHFNGEIIFSSIDILFLTPGSPVPFYVTPVVVVLGVATVMLMTCIIVIFGVLKARTRTHVTTESNVSRVNEKTKVPLRIDARDMYDIDDNNPDLIPCNKGSKFGALEPSIIILFFIFCSQLLTTFQCIGRSRCLLFYVSYRFRLSISCKCWSTHRKHETDTRKKPYTEPVFSRKLEKSQYVEC